MAVLGYSKSYKKCNEWQEFCEKVCCSNVFESGFCFFFSFKFIDIFQSTLKSKIEGGANKRRVRKRLKVNKREGVGLQ